MHCIKCNFGSCMLYNELTTIYINIDMVPKYIYCMWHVDYIKWIGCVCGCVYSCFKRKAKAFFFSVSVCIYIWRCYMHQDENWILFMNNKVIFFVALKNISICLKVIFTIRILENVLFMKVYVVHIYSKLVWSNSNGIEILHSYRL